MMPEKSVYTCMFKNNEVNEYSIPVYYLRCPVASFDISSFFQSIDVATVTDNDLSII